MNTSEARRQYEVALNAIDLAHCLHTGGANEITFQAWWDQFAGGKEFEAARKQWLRWKTDFKEYGIPCEFVDDGREKHVIVKRQAIEVAERLRAEAESVLEAEKEAPRRYPDAVKINGKSYRLKVYGRDVRPLNDREYAELKASIETKSRIEVPVLVDRDGNVVDGKHRLIIADELGLADVPIVVLADYDRERLHELAVQLNACRRQLSKQELAELRRQRQERALEKRAAGMSTRQIAEEEGVAPATIQKVLEASDEAAPLEVVGKDGRRRPSQRQPKTEQDARRQDVVALRAEDPHITVREIADQLGLSVGTVARALEALGEPTDDDAKQGSAGVVVASRRATPCLGVDPEEDDLRTCLDALLVGLERIQEKARGTEAADIAREAHAVVDTLIWRLVEDQTA